MSHAMFTKMLLIHHQLSPLPLRGMPPLSSLFSAIAGPKGPQRARSVHTRPKAARASVARPLYLKLLTRQTMNPNTRQTEIQRLDRQKSGDQAEQTKTQCIRGKCTQHIW